jgi:hypothetical protein
VAREDRDRGDQMSGRDHSETCATCGHERGGLNDVPCLCEAHHDIDADPRLSALNDGMAIRGVAAEAIRERDRLSQRCAELEAERDALKVRQSESRALIDTMIRVHDDVEKERDAALASVEKMRTVIAQFVNAVSAARRDMDNRGKGGQHVSFHGDFCNANPSVMTRLVTWARALEVAAIDAATKGTP